MKESYTEGIANHGDHESCTDIREDEREALDSGMYRIGIEPRKQVIQSVDAVNRDGRQHFKHRYREMVENSAWSETLGMYRNSSHGNREISRLARENRVRIGNPKGESR